VDVFLHESDLIGTLEEEQMGGEDPRELGGPYGQRLDFLGFDHVFRVGRVQH
jgi:hypothetical protein